MKTSVQLPSAYSTEAGRIVHISERLSRGTTFLCPFCEGEVNYRKGEKNQHCFYHLVEANCDPKPESLLHAGAKAYLLQLLLKKEPFPIHIPTLQHLPQELAQIFQSLSLNGFSVSSSSMPPFQFAKHLMEAPIAGVRPDVLSIGDRGSFAWEILVTHDVNESKKAVFVEGNIPFIEVTPVFHPPLRYQFFLYSYGGFELVKVRTGLFPFLFEAFKKELVSEFRNDLSANALREAKKPAALHSSLDVESRIRSQFYSRVSRETIENELTKKNTIVSLGKEFAFEVYSFGKQKTSEQEPSFIESAVLDVSRDDRTVTVDGKHLIEAPIAFVAGVLDGLREQGYLSGISNVRDQIIGFDFVFPSARLHKTIRKRILLSQEALHAEGIKVDQFILQGENLAKTSWFALADNGKKFNINYTPHFFQELLTLLCGSSKASFLLQKNKMGISTPVGIKLSGIPNRSHLAGIITKLLSDIVAPLLNPSK